jgi:hypothetical protein
MYVVLLVPAALPDYNPLRATPRRLPTISRLR